MANSGKNSNKSQFFITFRSCKHLDRKHTVFGKVVGGLETLDRMEKIETDSKDVPKESIVIKNVIVYVDPFKEMDDYIESERSKSNRRPEAGDEMLEHEKQNANASSTTVGLKKFRSGVGAFIDLAQMQDKESESSSVSISSSSKRGSSNEKSKFGDFSGW